MAEIFIAKSAVISILRVAAFLAAIIVVVMLGRNELAGLAKQGGAWIREQARLSRAKTGYVAAFLGRSSTLLGACTLVFGVFRAEYFENAEARGIAGVLSGIAVLAGCLVGLIVLAVTNEIIRQSRTETGS